LIILLQIFLLNSNDWWPCILFKIVQNWFKLAHIERTLHRPSWFLSIDWRWNRLIEYALLIVLIQKIIKSFAGSHSSLKLGTDLVYII
jgi:hypothetical protein